MRYSRDYNKIAGYINELQRISFISTFGSNGAGNVSTSLNNNHDREILEKIIDDLDHQMDILSVIHRKMALASLQDAHEETIESIGKALHDTRSAELYKEEEES